MAKIDLVKPIMPAVIVTLTLLLVNFVLGMLSYPVAPLYAVDIPQPVSAISGTVGHQFLAWLGGIIPMNQFFNTGTLILLLSAYLILLVGGLIVDNTGLPTMKGRVGSLATKIIYGTAVFYVLIVGFVMKSWGVLAGLAIHTAIVAFVAAWIADQFNVSM